MEHWVLINNESSQSVTYCSSYILNWLQKFLIHKGILWSDVAGYIDTQL